MTNIKNLIERLNKILEENPLAPAIARETVEALTQLTAGDVAMPPLDFEECTDNATFSCDAGYSPETLQAYGDKRAAAAVLAERERCAKLVEGNHLVSGGNGPNFSFGWSMALKACVDAIRKGTS